MGVHELGSQSARTDTGAVVRSAGRETLRIDYRGRTMPVPVDQGLGSLGVYLPRAPRWEDGEPVAVDDLAVVREAVVEVLRFWGFDTEFLELDG
ncbi:hypothetical protein [Actinoplanes derwentensis]|uniref:Immunity protein 74 n=1 Tax=Actinoplanes derwentensis TaxID=113562 RepID=A0A1H2CYL3_9ACTN|nr:hypothetical protein [Actinoplanes derwentensis]GID82896.1 hypothetical protein Ade03nite_18200 [Actinoplanes derwentensis]SDT75367.1 hypothetical protein SAMN04489716_7279 [Actinoplanes derwentensis]